MLAGWPVKHHTVEYQVKDGSKVSCYSCMTPVYEEDGNVSGILSILRDNTQFETVDEQRRQLMTVVEASKEAIFTQKLDGTILNANQAAEQMFGYSLNEMINHNISIIQPPELFGEEKRLVERALRGATVSDVETLRMRRNGSCVHVSASLTPITDKYGKPNAVATVLRDITIQKRTNQELRDSSLYVRSLIEASLDPLLTISLEGKITDVNYATELVTGFSREHLIGTDFWDYFTEAEKARAVQEGVWEKGSLKDCPLSIRHASGSTTDVLYNLTLYKNERGEPEGVFASARDMTEQNRIAEARERLNEELELKVAERTKLLNEANKELEAFSYSVSHDLRAPLRSLAGFSSILLEDYQDKLDEEGRDCLNRISRAAGKMSALIDDILRLSRIGRSKMERQGVDLSKIVSEIRNELELEPDKRSVNFTIGENITCTGDLNLIQIVLQNLISNAWKFTRHVQEAHIEFGACQKDGELVYFVRDNGAGFQMFAADKLFTPFERLHSDQDFPGNGIGLAIVKRIIQRHGGRIWAESTPGNGATFFFTLQEKILQAM